MKNRADIETVTENVIETVNGTVKENFKKSVLEDDVGDVGETFTYPQVLPGVTYDLQQQCAIQFGTPSKPCIGIDVGENILF